MTTRIDLAKLLADAPWVFRATLVERRLKCRRLGCRVCQSRGGHGPAYYLSLRGEDRKTHMIYVPKAHLDEARAGIAAYHHLKDALAARAARDLQRWQATVRRAPR